MFGFFCNFFAQKVLGDMARTRKALQTDGRTDMHEGKNNICLPQGDIILKAAITKVHKCSTIAEKKYWLIRGSNTFSPDHIAKWHE